MSKSFSIIILRHIRTDFYFVVVNQISMLFCFLSCRGYRIQIEVRLYSSLTRVE